MMSKDIQQTKEENLTPPFFFKYRDGFQPIICKIEGEKILYNRISKVLPCFRDGRTTETSYNWLRNDSFIAQRRGSSLTGSLLF